MSNTGDGGGDKTDYGGDRLKRDDDWGTGAGSSSEFGDEGDPKSDYGGERWEKPIFPDSQPDPTIETPDSNRNPSDIDVLEQRIDKIETEIEHLEKRIDKIEE